MSQPAFFISSALTIYGLYYTWKHHQEKEIAIEHDRIPRVQVTLWEKIYLEFVLMDGNISRMMDALCSLFLEKYDYNLKKIYEKPTAKYELVSAFLDYSRLIDKCRVFYRKYSLAPPPSSQDRNAFIRDWIILFDYDPPVVASRPYDGVQSYQNYLLSRAEKTIQSKIIAGFTKLQAQDDNDKVEGDRTDPVFYLNALLETKCINSISSSRDISESDYLFRLVQTFLNGSP